MNISKRLPTDIVQYIIPFTYKPQSKKLQESIKDFYRSYRELQISILSMKPLYQVYDALWNWYYERYGNYEKIRFLNEPSYEYYQSNKIKTKIIGMWALFTKPERASFIMHCIDCQERFGCTIWKWGFYSYP